MGEPSTECPDMALGAGWGEHCAYFSLLGIISLKLILLSLSTHGGGHWWAGLGTPVALHCLPLLFEKFSLGHIGLGDMMIG